MPTETNNSKYGHDYSTRVAIAANFLEEQFRQIETTAFANVSAAARAKGDHYRMGSGLFIATIQAEKSSQQILVNFCDHVFGEDATKEAMELRGLHAPIGVVI